MELWRLLALSGLGRYGVQFVRDHFICRLALAPYGDKPLWHSLVFSGY
jgi:hypothetical protein